MLNRTQRCDWRLMSQFCQNQIVASMNGHSPTIKSTHAATGRKGQGSVKALLPLLICWWDHLQSWFWEVAFLLWQTTWKASSTTSTEEKMLQVLHPSDVAATRQRKPQRPPTCLRGEGVEEGWKRKRWGLLYRPNLDYQPFNEDPFDQDSISNCWKLKA